MGKIAQCSKNTNIVTIFSFCWGWTLREDIFLTVSPFSDMDFADKVGRIGYGLYPQFVFYTCTTQQEQQILCFIQQVGEQLGAAGRGRKWRIHSAADIARSSWKDTDTTNFFFFFFFFFFWELTWNYRDNYLRKTEFFSSECNTLQVNAIRFLQEICCI